MRKIVFGITNLSIGGAERTLVDLCNRLSNKYDITIFTIYGNGILEKSLNSNIKIINIYKESFEEINFLNKKIISFKLLFLKKSIYKKYIENKYETEIAFLEGPISRLFSIKNKNAKKLAWIHTDVSSIFGSGLLSKIKKIINRKIYKNYNELIFISQDSLDRFNSTYNISANKNVIYNYINYDRILNSSNRKTDVNFENSHINFLSVCRLVKPKAIDRLIKVHSKLIKNGFINKIYIIGDGPEKKYLENLIKDYGIQDTFILLGNKENPYPYIKNCDYFCLLSYFEGYGIVIDEAKIFSKHIIITDTASKEALEGYNNKTIIKNDEDSIYEALKKIIVNNAHYNSTFNYDYTQRNADIIEKIIEKIGD